MILLVAFLTIVSSEAVKRDEVKYYVDLITELNQNAFTYVWPTNAEEYRSSSNRQKYGSYDFVVIGAGAAGTVVASRLSEVKNWNILLLEAGKYRADYLNVPHTYTSSYFTEYNWAYNSTSQKTACQGMVNQVCLYPRGKGVGGSTLINGLAYVRGFKADYDQWSRIAGNKRWGYKKVLPYFKKSEKFVHRDLQAPYDPEYHGFHGPLRVEYHLPRSRQLEAFLAANRELGFDTVDYNANKLGASAEQINTVNGERLDNAKAYLDPVKNRQNLHILTESYATKIRFDGSRATGVEFSRKGQNYFVEATKEVILCAGAFGSPQILMLSGVGPKQHLQDLGIPVVADLEVGSTLRDNSAFYGLSISTNHTEPVRPLSDYVQEYFRGYGPLTLPNNGQGLGMYESSFSKGTGVPDIELIFEPANATSRLIQRSFGLTRETFEDLWDVDYTRTITIHVIDLHSQSFGSVRLRSTNPYDYPVIDSNFISDSEGRDINTIYEGIQLVLKLLETKPFKAMDAKLQGSLRACKGLKYLSKDYWYCAIRQMTANVYHPLGTCAMGTDPKTAVVDSELKVFGLKNLRIADASVIPLAMACHTNAPTVMVGEQLGDLVKETYGVVNEL